MNRDEFRALCRDRVLVLDGATGTKLARRGLPRGVSPEAWVLENPDVLRELQHSYREAGSDIVYSCTFGANRIKLEEFGLGDQVASMNRALAALSREAVGDGLVFGDLAPSGRFVEPFGDWLFEDAVAVFAEQAEALREGGVDGFVIETMIDIQEARAALLGVRECCPDMPVLVTLTCDSNGRTLTGTDPVAALVTLQALGAAAVGVNCSTGPETMLGFIRAMKPHATVPLIAKPNAGMPKLVTDETVFDMAPAPFAEYAEAFVESGANLLGGCCGTTPKHIAALASAVRGCEPVPPKVEAVSALSSARETVFVGSAELLAVIGERINPTGKKKLQAELREGGLGRVRAYALSQVEAGASVLDVNVGASGVDETRMMRDAVALLAKTVGAPLCIDTTDPETMEQALRLYPGRALVNSVSGERDRIERMLPVAARYGAMFILLPLTDDGIPATCEERVNVVESVFAEAQRLGCHKADVVVDGLVMTVSGEPEAARETMRLIRWCSEDFGVNTTAGLSNVSFGLPEREWVNAAFLAMNVGHGLSMVIANPADETLMAVQAASDALVGRDPRAQRYAARFAEGARDEDAVPDTPAGRLYQCVVKGDDARVVQAVETALAAEVSAKELVDTVLIPAIRRVGELFDRRTYFLPQLMMSADAMRKAFDHLEPRLAESGDRREGPVVLLATVKGDIHDIGKNLVALMMKNYGFRVVDLGKDVPAETIVSEARATSASVVGLSALMTTTMTEMRTVLDLARAEKLDAKFMVGGAVVDQSYADDIGADACAADAIGAVRAAQKLTGWS